MSRVALDFKEFCVDPAVVIAVVLVFVCHPDPIVGVCPPDQFDFRGGVEREQIEIFSAGTVAATQLVRDHFGG